jgi:outer membrane receptor protein involved in Fe transport
VRVWNDSAGEVKRFIVGGDEGQMFDGYLKRKSSYMGFKGQITSEVNPEHTIKGGFEFNRHALRFYQHFTPRNVYQGVDSGGFQDVNRYGYDVFGQESDSEGWENSTKHPIDLALYLQDRLEYKGLIITGGFRYDYFDYKALRLRNSSLPTNPDSLGLPNKPPDDGTASTLDPNDTEDSKAFTRVSPRLGVAFPISDKTQMRLSYGQFFQRPELQNLYVGYDFLEYMVKTGPFYVSVGNPNL